jgi:NTE family protein
MERGDSESWAAVPLFGGFSGVIGAQLNGETERISLAAGEWLFREGDRANHAYVVHSGRVEIVAEHPTEVVLRQVKRSEMLGELALLTGGLRTTSARACRDSELTLLSRAQFEKLLASPVFAFGLLQAMATQVSSHTAPSVEPTTPGTIAVVALDPAAPVAWIGAELTTAIAARRSVEELRPDADRDESQFRGLLKRTEARRQHVVLTAGCDSMDPWTRFCVREADVVVAVSTGSPNPDWLQNPKILEGCELIILDAPLSAELLAVAPREVQVVRGETAMRAAICATARRLTGQSVGLVLSGGGARALAHLGALEELEKTGITIDRYAGASMGAIVSGLAARGAGSGEIIEMCRRMMLDDNPSSDYTVPAYSLIRGAKTRRALQDAFGDHRIEELPRRWFCVTSDIVARELIVHRTGLMADAVYSSMALPGVYPPIPTEDGRLLVDGGVMDNLPVETMARRAEGPIIAIDVSQRLGMPPPARRPGLERVARRMRRVLTGYDQRLPALRETIHWTIALGSTDTVNAALKHADLVISPRVEGIGILDWRQLPRAVEIGRRAAREALEAAGPQVEAWKR